MSLFQLFLDDARMKNFTSCFKGNLFILQLQLYTYCNNIHLREIIFKVLVGLLPYIHDKNICDYEQLIFGCLSNEIFGEQNN